MKRNLGLRFSTRVVVAGLSIVSALSALPLYRDSLPNGLIVLTFEDRRLPVISAELCCRSGAGFDPVDKSGVASLTARLLGRGTTTLSADSFASIVDFLGAQVGADAAADYSTVRMKVLNKDFETALDLMADAVRRPAFDAQEFRRARDQSLAGARRNLDNPGSVVRQELDRRLFPNHPLGNSPAGDTLSLPRIAREDLVAFHRTHYVPNNCFIVVVGDISRQAVRAQVVPRFEDWQPGEIPVRVVTEPEFPAKLQVKLITRPEMNQTYVIFGHPGIKVSDPDALPVRMMSYVLGGSALSSRLGIAVREKEGLAYDVRCWFDRGTLRSAFRASVQTAKPKEAIRLMFEAIAGMHDSGATAAELNRAHNYYTGSFPLTYSSSEGKLNAVHDIELYRLGMDWLDQFPDRVRAVTPAQIAQAARDRLRPGQYRMVVMGNVTREELGLADVEWVE